MFESSFAGSPRSAAGTFPAATGAIALHGLIFGTLVLVSLWQLPAITPPDLGVVMWEPWPPSEPIVYVVTGPAGGGGGGGGSQSAAPPPPPVRREDPVEQQPQTQEPAQPEQTDPSAPVAAIPDTTASTADDPEGTATEIGVPGGTGDGWKGPGSGTGNGPGAGPGDGPGNGPGDGTGIGDGSDGTWAARFDPPVLLTRVEPVYPQAAIKARREGVILLEVTVTPEGLPGRIDVLRHDPLLERAAVDAVKRWRWKPAGMTGRGVSVVIRVEVSFQLR